MNIIHIAFKTMIIYTFNIAMELIFEFKRVPNTTIYVSKCGKMIFHNSVLTAAPNSKDHYPKYTFNDTYLYVHRMVALAWVYNPSSEFKIVDHIDNCKNNNDASNLRWADPTLNALNRQGEDTNVCRMTTKSSNGTFYSYWRVQIACAGKFLKKTFKQKKDALNFVKIEKKRIFYEYYMRKCCEFPNPNARKSFHTLWTDEIMPYLENSRGPTLI